MAAASPPKNWEKVNQALVRSAGRRRRRTCALQHDQGRDPARPVYEGDSLLGHREHVGLQCPGTFSLANHRRLKIAPDID